MSKSSAAWAGWARDFRISGWPPPTLYLPATPPLSARWRDVLPRRPVAGLGGCHGRGAASMIELKTHWSAGNGALFGPIDHGPGGGGCRGGGDRGAEDPLDEMHPEFRYSDRRQRPVGQAVRIAGSPRARLARTAGAGCALRRRPIRYPGADHRSCAVRLRLTGGRRREQRDRVTGQQHP